MPHEEIAKMVGSSHGVFNTKGNVVDHCCKDPAGMGRGMRDAEHEVAETLMPKRKV